MARSPGTEHNSSVAAREAAGEKLKYFCVKIFVYLYECFDSVARGEAARGTRGSPGTSFNFQHFNSDVSSPAPATRELSSI